MFLLQSAIANTNLEEPTSIAKFNQIAEEILLETAILLKIIIEGIAIVILVLSIVKAVQELVFRNKRVEREEKLGRVRLDLGIALALSLEFLLAADIVATAVSPSWNAVGKLAAISAIRTFLNFFLEREVKELAKQRRKPTKIIE